MSDDSNQKNRPPRKGGRGGGRDGGGFDGRGPGDRPPRGRPPAGRGTPRSEARPERAGPGRGRPDRAEGERSFRPRVEAGERPARFERKPGRGGFERDGGERTPRPRTPAPGGKLLPSMANQEPERIAKVMARAGVASRRDSEAMIAEGRVSVNGTIIDSPALDVGPDDVVLVDGEPLPLRERTRLWFYHKPRGLVTTNHDPEGRPTVFDALPEDLPRVLSIGRLDINTEGLLLLTNDGGLARLLELPQTGWLRRYRVRAFGSVTQDVLDTLKAGVTIDGVSYGPITARFEREQGHNTWLVVDLREGKNREVKRVLEHIGLTVNRLIRVSFGPFQLGELAEGQVEEVRSRVLKDQLGPELAAQAGVDFDAPTRDPVALRAPSAPSGDDRPRRRSRDETEAGAPAGRPLRGDKPWTRTVWRAEDAAPARPKRAAPRRGTDPKAERQTREEAGSPDRRREKAVADPTGRRVVVERVARPPEPEAPREVTIRLASPERPERPARAERPQRTFRTEGEARPPRRGPDDRQPRPFRGERDGTRPERSGPRPGGFKARADGERSGGFRGRADGERPGGFKGRQDGERRFGGPRDDAGPRRFGKPEGRPGAGPRGPRPAGGKPGGRPGGGKGPRPGGPPRGGGRGRS